MALAPRPVPTLDTSPSGSLSSAKASGTRVHSTAETRNDRTEPSNTSWLTTPARETTRPDDVARKAAKAPATMSAVSSSPAGPGNTREGSVSTTVSATPGTAMSGATTRAMRPMVPDAA